MPQLTQQSSSVVSSAAATTTMMPRPQNVLPPSAAQQSARQTTSTNSAKAAQKLWPLPLIVLSIALWIFLFAGSVDMLIHFKDIKSLLVSWNLIETIILAPSFLWASCKALQRWRAALPPALQRQWWKLTGQAAFLVVSTFGAAWGCFCWQKGTTFGWCSGLVSLLALVYLSREGLRLRQRMRALEKAAY